MYLKFVRKARDKRRKVRLLISQKSNMPLDSMDFFFNGSRSDMENAAINKIFNKQYFSSTQLPFAKIS